MWNCPILPESWPLPPWHGFKNVPLFAVQRLVEITASGVSWVPLSLKCNTGAGGVTDKSVVEPTAYRPPGIMGDKGGVRVRENHDKSCEPSSTPSCSPSSLSLPLSHLQTVILTRFSVLVRCPSFTLLLHRSITNTTTMLPTSTLMVLGLAQLALAVPAPSNSADSATSGAAVHALVARSGGFWDAGCRQCNLWYWTINCVCNGGWVSADLNPYITNDDGTLQWL